MHCGRGKGVRALHTVKTCVICHPPRHLRILSRPSPEQSFPKIQSQRSLTTSQMTSEQASSVLDNVFPPPPSNEPHLNTTIPLMHVPKDSLLSNIQLPPSLQRSISSDLSHLENILLSPSKKSISPAMRSLFRKIMNDDGRTHPSAILTSLTEDILAKLLTLEKENSDFSNIISKKNGAWNYHILFEIISLFGHHNIPLSSLILQRMVEVLTIRHPSTERGDEKEEKEEKEMEKIAKMRNRGKKETKYSPLSPFSKHSKK